MLLALAVAAAVVIPAPTLPTEPCFFNSKAVRRVVRYHTGQLRQCFMRVLQYRGTPDLELQVELHFRYDASGRVFWSDTTGAVDPAITACLDAEVRTWTFAAGSTSMVHINYPLRFVLNS